ncbi:hypothetical protein RND81_07G104900 [Saponaria officinalis]|uniref:ENT domain-containing protein n=1 Tax=Saponaria officinalis TaxID=3572 RepID=A0AAW1JPS3_SAPOF
MTRFKKGTKVEVLSLKEGSSGSWRCAEIIDSNSRRFTVRYDGDFELLGNSKVEKVSRKAIRPYPAPVDVLQNWVPGDVVEVFHNFSWKMATILKGVGRDHVLVRLLGSALDIKVDKYDVRARLRWQDGEWIVIEKDANKCEDLRFRFPSSQNDTKQPRKMVTFVSGRKKGDNLESKAVRLKTVKRKLFDVHSQVEKYSRPNKKTIRFGNKESVWNEFNDTQRLQLPEKVGKNASSRDVLHEKSIHPYLINKMNGGYDTFLEKEKKYGDDVSVSSSVGSCSVYRNPLPGSYRVFPSDQSEENDSQSSDAESFCELRPKEEYRILPPKEALRDEIHRLELHAYRSIIGALYASGPLNWERELLLTNLRESLRISNDEHLAEIRNLVSSSSICIPAS